MTGRHAECADCSTPASALTGAEWLGDVVALQHDSTCPAYRAMTDEQRHEDHGDYIVVHVSTDDRTTRED